ncbi:hypothetical protein EIP91_000481 [Steccherinum ochraceum]|uniref:Uncharacterized protein n=1 Tax=Steccherinum ochraceum TaxID=92696 RepID=A0A4R0RU29_9APHY|nr:hypothetical protein EIP91_000481 [Steccherinum ochraceum]
MSCGGTKASYVCGQDVSRRIGLLGRKQLAVNMQQDSRICIASSNRAYAVRKVSSSTSGHPIVSSSSSRHRLQDLCSLQAHSTIHALCHRGIRICVPQARKTLRICYFVSTTLGATLSGTFSLTARSTICLPAPLATGLRESGRTSRASDDMDARQHLGRGGGDTMELGLDSAVFSLRLRGTCCSPSARFLAFIAKIII